MELSSQLHMEVQDDGRRNSHEQAGPSNRSSSSSDARSQGTGSSSSGGSPWKQAGYVVLSLSQPLAVLPPPFPSASPLYLHVDGLAVTPEFRRRGIGTALLNSAERLGGSCIQASAAATAQRVTIGLWKGLLTSMLLLLPFPAALPSEGMGQALHLATRGRSKQGRAEFVRVARLHCHSNAHLAMAAPGHHVQDLAAATAPGRAAGTSVSRGSS